MIPGQQAAIIVLTNSISRGDTADWIAQTILQALLGSGSGSGSQRVDLVPIAEGAAERWRTRYTAMVDTLERERTPGTKAPPPSDVVGSYRHKTGALWLDVSEAAGVLKFQVNGRASQTHTLQHYHYDTFYFLPSADERIRRAMFHYTAPGFLLHFEREAGGGMVSAKWKLGNQVTDGEVFARVS